MPAKKKVSYSKLMKQHLKVLRSLQYESGLFSASAHNGHTGYDKSWLRDNFYECLPFMIIGDHEAAKKTYKSLLTIFLKHEDKIDHAIAAKPKHTHQYIHARYNPHTFNEYWEEWGNKQHDAIGEVLYGIGWLEGECNIRILENEDYKRIVKKLVDYLGVVMYWRDPDNGVWEEEEEIHASSIGACVAGLTAIKKYTDIRVPQKYIKSGKSALRHLLPRESEKKFVDLALLSLIYPFHVVTAKERDIILKDTIYHLERKRGVIRYKGDQYYNKNKDGHSEEAEWTFGFSWIAIIYEMMHKKKKAKEYIEKAISSINKKGEVPELYFSNSAKFVNSPLGWSESMFIIALYYFNEKHL